MDKIFQCPVCFTKYATKQEVNTCLHSHKFPVEVVNWYFHTCMHGDFANYPEVIEMKMQDGALVTYRRIFEEFENAE